MTSKTIKVKPKTQPAVVMEAEVARKIRQHARSSMKAEVCGVLLGSADQDRTVIDACVAGINAAQGGAHVTFTQDTWEHIYKIKDQQFPDSKIVGWYHSHPGFGVFLSEHDLFIQENFFSSPHQVAWVYDPHSDEEGCYGWVGGATEKLSSMRFGYSQSVEMNDSPQGEDAENSDVDLELQVRVRPEGAKREPAWVKWVSRSLLAVSLIGLGCVGGWFFWDVSPWARAALPTMAHEIQRQDIMQLQQVCEPELRACQTRLVRESLSGAPPGEPQIGNQPQPSSPAPQQQKGPSTPGKASDGKH